MSYYTAIISFEDLSEVVEELAKCRLVPASFKAYINSVVVFIKLWFNEFCVYAATTIILLLFTIKCKSQQGKKRIILITFKWQHMSNRDILSFF